MKKLIFYAHDPGSYDVVYPVFEQFENGNFVECELFCEGPAGKINSKYKSNLGDIINIINEYIESDKLLGFVTGRNWGIDYELQAITLCKNAQITTFVILDYWNSYSLSLKNESKTIVNPDYYIMMDQIASYEAIKEGVPKEIINVLGHPGLDKYISYSKKNTISKMDSKKILFLCQPLSKIYGETLGYTEEKVIGDCINAVNDIKNMTLDIKFHPKDDLELINKYNERVVRGELSEIIPKYDLIIGMSTMGLLHAVLIGSLAVSYQPNIKDKDYCITNKLGITKLIKTYDELVILMKNLLDNKTEILDNKILKSYIWSDGKSTDRVCKFIKDKLK